MKHKTDPGKNGFLITAFIMMLISLSIQLMWLWVVHVKTLDTSEKKTDFYLSLFPSFLQKPATLEITCFFMAALAFIFSALSIRRVRKSFRWMAYSCIVISLAVAILSVFQLL